MKKAVLWIVFLTWCICFSATPLWAGGAPESASKPPSVEPVSEGDSAGKDVIQNIETSEQPSASGENPSETEPNASADASQNTWKGTLPVTAPEVPPLEPVSEAGEVYSEEIPKNVEVERPPESKEKVSEASPAQSPVVALNEPVPEDKVAEKRTADEDVESEQPGEGDVGPLVKDPYEPYNRAMFVFNDKVFHYFIKPVYTGYNSMVPEKARVSVRNFFDNVKMPIRFFNCLFQGEFKGAGTEMLRFMVNSTVGVGGLFDPAKSKFNLQKKEKDFGQTLAKHRMGSGSYIVWPFIGPSTTRDTVGLVGDAALYPLTWISYFFLTPIEGFGGNTYDTVNDISIDKGSTYENITKPAVDPYIALQDAYLQNRNKKNKE